MKIGLYRVCFHIDSAQSLKAKRQVMRSIKDRLRNQFNVSVAEIGSNELWQTGEIAVVTVANDHGFVNSVLEKINQFFEFPKHLDLTPYSYYEVMSKENRLKKMGEGEDGAEEPARRGRGPPGVGQPLRGAPWGCCGAARAVPVVTRG